MAEAKAKVDAEKKAMEADTLSTETVANMMKDEGKKSSDKAKEDRQKELAANLKKMEEMAD